MENSKTTDPRMLTGMFSDRRDAESAYHSLKEKGYTDDEINLIMSNDTRKKYYSKGETEIGTKAMEGAGAGSAIGGAIGAVAGIIATLGTSILIPGLGIIYESGIKDGKIVVGVHPRNEEDARYFEDDWRRYKGEVIL